MNKDVILIHPYWSKRMASTVKLTAQCSCNKEVVLEVIDFTLGLTLEKHVLQNGEDKEVEIFEDRTVVSYERDKEPHSE
jgi:hypothetical protein